MDNALAKSIQTRALSLKLGFDKPPPTHVAVINQEILDAMARFGMQAAVAYTHDGRAVTFEELAENGMPDEGLQEGELIKILTFDLVPEKLYVIAGDCTHPLARLRLTVAYFPVEAPASGEADAGGEPEDELPVKVDYIEDVFVQTKPAHPEGSPEEIILQGPGLDRRKTP